MSWQIWTATSIHSVCQALPTKRRGPGVDECLKKTSLLAHSPAYVSRHASSLAMPQEDSMCGDGPTVPVDNNDKSSLLKVHPEHTSRHASSLAVPQEDSMCGDGPTIPQVTAINQNDRAVQHTAMSMPYHALAASIALRSFGANESLAPTRSASHCINQSEPHTLLRRPGCGSKYGTKQTYATCRLLFAR